MIKANKYLWNGIFILCFILIGLAWYSNGFRLTGSTLTCPNESLGCYNPLYESGSEICEKDQEICEVEYLEPGQTIGTPESDFSKRVPFAILILIVLGLFLESILRLNKNENTNN